DAGYVLLHCGGGHDKRVGDALIGLPFCQVAEDITLAGAELVERPLTATAPEHAPDDLRIESAAAAGDTSDGIPESIDIADTLLQQVADALGAVADQVQGVVLLVVLGEHQHAGIGKRTP